MPPLALNRRRFLGCSAAASLALSQGAIGEAADSDLVPVRLGVIGIGNRGTALLRALLELPGTQVMAVADAEPKHRLARPGNRREGTGQAPPKCSTTRGASSTRPVYRRRRSRRPV